MGDRLAFVAENEALREEVKELPFPWFGFGSRAIRLDKVFAYEASTLPPDQVDLRFWVEEGAKPHEVATDFKEYRRFIEALSRMAGIQGAALSSNRSDSPPPRPPDDPPDPSPKDIGQGSQT